MKFLKYTLFVSILMIGFAMTAAAQQEGDKKNVPDKPKPPVVIVNLDKKDPKPKEKENEEKKPRSFLLSLINENTKR